MINKEEWNTLESLLTELVEGQHAELIKCGRRIVPHLTTDDLMQPNDFPELENHAVFRYEEGVLSGMQSVQTALRAWYKQFKANCQDS